MRQRVCWRHQGKTKTRSDVFGMPDQSIFKHRTRTQQTKFYLYGHLKNWPFSWDIANLLNILDAVLRAKSFVCNRICPTYPRTAKKSRGFSIERSSQHIKNEHHVCWTHQNKRWSFQARQRAHQIVNPRREMPQNCQSFCSLLSKYLKRLARIRLMPPEHAVKHMTLAPDARNRFVPWDSPS